MARPGVPTTAPSTISAPIPQPHHFPSLQAPSPPHKPTLPAAGPRRPKPSCLPGGSSGCSRRRRGRGGRGRRGAAKARPWPGMLAAVPSVAGKAPALRFWPPCCAGSYLCPRPPLPARGGGGKRGGRVGFVVFFIFFSYFFSCFPKSHPSESVIEVIQCRSASGTARRWQIPRARGLPFFSPPPSNRWPRGGEGRWVSLGRGEGCRGMLWGAKTPKRGRGHRFGGAGVDGGSLAGLLG